MGKITQGSREQRRGPGSRDWGWESRGTWFSQARRRRESREGGLRREASWEARPKRARGHKFRVCVCAHTKVCV